MGFSKLMAIARNFNGILRKNMSQAKPIQLLVHGQGNIENAVGLSAEYFFFQFLGLAFWKEKSFSVNKEGKPVINSVLSIYFLCN